MSDILALRPRYTDDWPSIFNPIQTHCLLICSKKSMDVGSESGESGARKRAQRGGRAEQQTNNLMGENKTELVKPFPYLLMLKHYPDFSC